MGDRRWQGALRGNLGNLHASLGVMLKNQGRLPEAVGKVAAVGAGLWLAPTAVLGIAKAKQASKAQKKQIAAQERIAKMQIDAQERATIAMQTPNVAPAAAPMRLTPSIAPPAGLVQHAMPTPTFTSVAPSREGAVQYEPIEPGGAPSTPKWLIPAAIGGVGLLALLMRQR